MNVIVRHFRHLAFSVAVLTGCNAGTLPMHDRRDYREGDHELIEEAAAVLGLAVEWHDVPYGTVQLELRDECAEDNKCGRAWRWYRCQHGPTWAERRVRVIAHELGHVLGLDHIEGSHMLMYKNRSDDAFELTYWEQNIVDRYAARVVACNRSMP